MENFEEILHKDLHQFLQSMNEVDERLPECPDVEDKWEEIAKAYIRHGMGHLFQDRRPLCLHARQEGLRFNGRIYP